VAIILLIDAPGGPQPAELARSMAPFGPVRIISVRWGKPEVHARRLAALSQLGLVEVVDRPDQTVEAGLGVAAGHDIRAVVALSEIVSFYAGLLARLLGLPANPPEALFAVRHKDHQRRLLQRAGVPSPAWRTVSTADDLRACGTLRFPVILKPATGVGSLCVFKAEDTGELADCYPEALRRYREDPRPNGSPPIFLVEEEIPGTHWHEDQRFGYQVSVESLADDETVSHLGVTSKLPLAPPFREVGHVMPSLLSGEQARRIEGVAADAIRALGLTTGAVHTELMLTAEGPVVLEVNGRLGGAVYELMKFSRGYDVVQDIVRTACGQEPLLPGAAVAYAAFFRPQPPEGVFIVKSIDKVRFQQAMRMAEWGVLDKAEGAVLDSRNGTNSNLARFIVTAHDSEELFRKIDTVNSAVRTSVRLESIT
jgi:biotin carboxylase